MIDDIEFPTARVGAKGRCVLIRRHRPGSLRATDIGSSGNKLTIDLRHTLNARHVVTRDAGIAVIRAIEGRREGMKRRVAIKINRRIRTGTDSRNSALVVKRPTVFVEGHDDVALRIARCD